MNLSESVGNYLNAWEGHNNLLGEALNVLTNVISKSTLYEINTQYNTLSQQNLWTDSLIDVFHDEILNRILTESSFLISTAWKSVEQWRSDPFVNIQIGIDDTHYVTDKNGDIVDSKTKGFSLSNNNFQQNVQDNIIRMIIRNKVITPVESGEDKIQIVGLMNFKDPNEMIPFLNKALGLKSISGVKNYRIDTVNANIYESPDFNTMKRMLLGLETETFEIVDKYTNINELEL